jgi:hypothetical protein
MAARHDLPAVPLSHETTIFHHWKVCLLYPCHVGHCWPMLGDSTDSPGQLFGFVGSWWCEMTFYVPKHNANLSSIIWNVSKKCIFGATLLTLPWALLNNLQGHFCVVACRWKILQLMEQWAFLVFFFTENLPLQSQSYGSVDRELNYQPILQIYSCKFKKCSLWYTICSSSNKNMSQSTKNKLLSFDITNIYIHAMFTLVCKRILPGYTEVCCCLQLLVGPRVGVWVEKKQQGKCSLGRNSYPSPTRVSVRHAHVSEPTYVRL